MFKNYNQNQIQLLPANLNQSLPADHLARLISQAVDGMDTSAIEHSYSYQGQHAYHPKMLIKVLVYGYAVGIRSSRKLADRLNEDLVFMWLSGRQTPDFRTIADFRKAKLIDIKVLFVQILALCQDLGMVRVGKVSFDGTKMKADASGSRMLYRKVLNKRRDRIKELVDDIFDEAENLDREEEKLLGDSTEHRITGLDLKKVEQKLNKLKKRKRTLAKAEMKLKAKEEDINQKLRSMRQDRNSMSATDKHATLMKMKEGHFAPAYNVQIATENQVILAYGVSSNRNDQRLLKPMLKEVKDNTGFYPKTAITDCGYGTKANWRFLKQEKIVAFVPYNNIKQELSLWRQGVKPEPPKRIDKELAKYKLLQKLRYLSARGKQMMERRRKDVEPTFGNLKRNLNFRHFHLRGKPKCLMELGLVSIAHNLKKIKSHLLKTFKTNLTTAQLVQIPC